ncbi:MAG: hypothetical protein M3032_10015 [Verrucomicrobiota bacterium]|nr:hypothetical protein [Verrucomicrobiota bacterium]
MKRVFLRQLGACAVALTVCGFPLAQSSYAQKRAGVLTRLSARAVVRGGDGALIGGFATRADATNNPVSLLIEAVGPSLSRYGIPAGSVLRDPLLRLFRAGDATPFATNDNWRQDRETADLLTFLNMQPGDELESALYRTVPTPADHTAVVTGQNGGVGIGLLQIFGAPENVVTSLSARALVESGDGALIGGVFVEPDLQRSSTARVIVRAIGPSLAQYGITNPVLDPNVTLYDQNGVILATNDNWRDGAASDLQRAGLAPPDNREAALVAELRVGSYTAIVRSTGQPNGSGIALVEIYDASILP